HHDLLSFPTRRSSDLPENFFPQYDEATRNVLKTFQEIVPEKLNYRYAPDKWTIQEVLQHLTDTDRSFSYRAMVCLRMDNETPLRSEEHTSELQSRFDL